MFSSSVADNILQKKPIRSFDLMEQNCKDVWENFYRRHSRSFWFYIYKICGNEQMADDIFQESFVKFLKAKPTILNERHMKAYLYKIAFRLFVDQRRRIKIERKAMDGEKQAFEKRLHSNRHESEPHQAEEMEKTFKHLRPKNRMLLWLAYVEGYSYREIAQITGTKENSLKVQLFRAREELAEVIKKREREGRWES